MKKIFSTAYKKASAELAREMSRQLKRNAYSDGWNPEVAAGLTVSYDNGAFSTSHNPAHSTTVFDMEYGTEQAKGKGTIRNMHNSTDEHVDRFAALYEKWVMKS